MSCFRQDRGDASRGRRALASRRIRQGERVLLANATALAALAACGWCLRRGGALSRCGGCRLLRYCSRRCQERDWRDGGHALECAAWRGAVSSDANPQTLLLVARLAAKLYMEEGADSDRRAVQELLDHEEDHEKEKLQQFGDMAQLVLLVLARSKLNVGRKTLEELREELLDKVVGLLCRVNCNAFSVCDDANAPVGIGVFPQGALFNHSCEPNCVVGFRGRQMVVHAIRPIAKDEELLVRWNEPNEPGSGSH